MSSINSRVVGLDIGGSKTHAIAAPLDGGSGFREVLAGSANLSSVGLAEATRQLSTVLDQIGRADITAICAGAAGVESPEQEMRLAALIQSQVPGAAVRIVHDSALILAAAGVQHGIALISGTGSVIWGRTPDGRTARAGGWGYLLGDEGSGYWVAREAVRHALERSDRGEQPDRLAQQLTADCGLRHPEQLLDHFYATPERRYWAGHSQLVFALAGDREPAAMKIVSGMVDALAQLVRTVAGRLQISGPVVLGGGLLMHQPMARAALTERLAAAGYSDVRTLTDDPVHGALNLARELAAGL